MAKVSLPTTVVGVWLILSVSKDSSATPLDFRLFISDGHGLDSIVLRFKQGDGVEKTTGTNQGPSLLGMSAADGGIGAKPSVDFSGNFPRNPPCQYQYTPQPVYTAGQYVSGSPPWGQKSHFQPPWGLGPAPVTGGVPPGIPPAAGFGGGFSSGVFAPVSQSGGLPSSEGDGGGDAGSSFLARGRPG